MLTWYEEVTPLANAIRRSGLSGAQLNKLCKRHGITRLNLDRFAAGKSRPAPWLAARLASEFRSTASLLFPDCENER